VDFLCHGFGDRNFAEIRTKRAGRPANQKGTSSSTTKRNENSTDVTHLWGAIVNDSCHCSHCIRCRHCRCFATVRLPWVLPRLWTLPLSLSLLLQDGTINLMTRHVWTHTMMIDETALK
jgi:hypothetical protein